MVQKNSEWNDYNLSGSEFQFGKKKNEFFKMKETSRGRFNKSTKQDNKII